jgi:hypothetical protein
MLSIHTINQTGWVELGGRGIDIIKYHPYNQPNGVGGAAAINLPPLHTTIHWLQTKQQQHSLYLFFGFSPPPLPY